MFVSVYGRRQAKGEEFSFSGLNYGGACFVKDRISNMGYGSW